MPDNKVPDKLFLRLAEDRIDWLMLDSVSGQVQVRGSGLNLDEFAERTQGLEWDDDPVVMLSIDEVLLTTAAVPSRQMRQILQAVPFAVEDKLAEDIEECHFAIGERLSSGDLRVGVINRARFSQWRTKLRELGIKPGEITVESDHLRAQSGLTVLVDDDDVLLSTESGAGYRFGLDQLSLVVGMFDESVRQSIKLLVPVEQAETIHLVVNQINAELDVLIEVEQIETECFEYLCLHRSATALNLQQGEFRVEARKAKRSGVWRSAAILAGIAFVLHLAAQLGQGYYLDMKARQYTDEAQALYRSVFPNDKNVKDMSRRWRTHLKGDSDGGDGFMPLFAQAAQSLPGSNLTLQNINYNESRGDLILQIQAPRSEQLVLFSQTLAKAGLDAEIGTISQEDNFVRGSIKVKSFGGS